MSLAEFIYDPEKPGDYAEQHAQWVLCRDTWHHTIETYPGSAAEQATHVERPKVVTSKARR